MTADQIVGDFQARWSAAFRARDCGALVALYDPHALFFGSAPDLCADHRAILAYFEGLPSGLALADFPPLKAREIAADLIIASGFWSFTLAGERIEFRLSWTLAAANGDWRIAQHHAGLKPAVKP